MASKCGQTFLKHIFILIDLIIKWREWDSRRWFWRCKCCINWWRTVDDFNFGIGFSSIRRLQKVIRWRMRKRGLVISRRNLIFCSSITSCYTLSTFWVSNWSEKLRSSHLWWFSNLAWYLSFGFWNSLTFRVIRSRLSSTEAIEDLLKVENWSWLN